MTTLQVPRIFDASRLAQRRRRMAALHNRDCARFIVDDAIDDVIERLSFVRHEPARSLILGEYTQTLAPHLRGTFGQSNDNSVVEGDVFDRPGCERIDPEQPYPDKGFDFVAVIGLLHAVNDLPGALIHMHNAVRPGGLMIASFVGGASLPQLRAAMLAADGDRPAARIHPLVDPRAAPQLMQRAGWNDPVVDTHTITARYSAMDRLIHDLREQGLTGVLADQPPAIGKAGLRRAQNAFSDAADPDGKVSESFEIVTLTGRRSLAGT
ncbi:MAG: methyltransferase domain-containing protein [Erythrobacter sp.]